MLAGFAAARIENFELRNVGQQTDAGRYPIHYHLARDAPADTYVRSSCIHTTFARCVTIHGTNGVEVR